MKKIFRTVVKFIFMPFRLIFFSYLIFVIHFLKFVDWVYENEDEWDRRATESMLKELKSDFANSFKIF